MTHRDFAMLRFTCPHGHDLGRAQMDYDGSWYVEEGSSLTWVADKLRARCGRCASGGRVLDLQASGAKVEERLRELIHDATRGMATYPLGG